MSTNLVPGQRELGNLLFGRHTAYPISSMEIQSYNVNAQDAQAPMADEIMPMQENFVPAPITFEIGVLEFHRNENMEVFSGRIFNEEPMRRNLNKIALEWRGDDIRKNPGAARPIRFCQRDGSVILAFGRPRKFQATAPTRKNCYYTVNAEFQRLDTLFHSDIEYFEAVDPGQTVTLTRDKGDLSCWFRCLITGPAVNPHIVIGDLDIELDWTLAGGEIVEISSYPWSRRVVNSSSLNLGAKLIGETQYLDKLRFPLGVAKNITWTAGGTTGSSGMLFCWRDSYVALT